MKIPNRKGLLQITFNHSLDIDLKNFINLYKNYTAEPYSLLVSDTTTASDNPLRDSNGIQIHKHLVCKGTLNHLPKIRTYVK